MPHKKNPDVFESCADAVTDPAIRTERDRPAPRRTFPSATTATCSCSKDILFPATTEIKRTLSMCDFMLAHLKVNTDILDERKYDYLFTVEDVNRLVLAGVPFREAYKQVGMAVQRGEYHPTREVHHTHEGSIGNLCTAQIRRKMERVMSEFE